MRQVILLVVCVLVVLLIRRYASSSDKGGDLKRAWSETPAVPGVLAGRQGLPVEVVHEAGAPGSDATGVLINRRELTREQAATIVALYHYAPLPGRYWYDARSGAWGLEGREAAGFLIPGHDFGTLAADASAGHTGVFINGRQLNLIEAARLQQTFGAVYPGHWWLDGRTGYYGLEGNPMPLGNIITAMQTQRSGRGGDNFWYSSTAGGNDNGQSGYVDVNGTIAGFDR